MSVQQLDARNMLCPMPVIKVQNKVKDLAHGDILEVLCTDPGVLHDIPAWCRMYGHEILEIIEKEKEIMILLKVVNE